MIKNCFTCSGSSSNFKFFLVDFLSFLKTLLYQKYPQNILSIMLHTFQMKSLINLLNPNSYISCLVNQLYKNSFKIKQPNDQHFFKSFYFEDIYY